MNTSGSSSFGEGLLGESDHLVTMAAPAKLTLSLKVIGVRADGLHLIDAEMVTLDFFDTLVINPNGRGLVVVGGSDDVPTGQSNLVNRALGLAGRKAGVELTKRIPSQAGLGGGSSDAGAILRWAGLDPANPLDLEHAASIGADVAFCLVGGRARVRGVGEQVEQLPFRPMDVTLLTPPVQCSTPAVYRAWDELARSLGRPAFDDAVVINDLEQAAIVVAPELAEWRDKLADSTGVKPTLAGSGSTWFVEGHFPGPGRIIAKTTPMGWSSDNW